MRYSWIAKNYGVDLIYRNRLRLIAENKGFQIYFDCNKQAYSVYKDGKFLIGNKYKYSEVKCYLD